MSEEVKIDIRNLYKVFGENPKAMMKHVHEGTSKQELLEQYNHVLGLRDINLEIPKRQIQVIMGLSGSGKSTLIRHLNRLIDPTEGEIWVDGDNVLDMSEDQLRDLRRFKMSMVFQKFGLLPHRTVRENVEYGLEIQGVKPAEANGRSARWLERVGLSGFEDRYPGQLSGGMQQRVGLARALATDSDILLMDEAFSALDPLIRADMQSILLDLQDELHKTIVFITHDLDEALRIGDRIAILRDGAIIQSGDPQSIIMKPADEYITDFIREINRAKVIQLRSLASGDAAVGAPELNARITLDEALPALHAAPGQKANVISVDGKLLGAVTLEGALAALAPPEGERTETY